MRQQSRKGVRRGPNRPHRKVSRTTISRSGVRRTRPMWRHPTKLGYTYSWTLQAWVKTGPAKGECPVAVVNYKGVDATILQVLMPDMDAQQTTTRKGRRALKKEAIERLGVAGYPSELLTKLKKRKWQFPTTKYGGKPTVRAKKRKGEWYDYD